MARISGNEAKAIFADNLRRIMDERGLDGPSLAQLMGLEKQSIYSWLKMNSFPSATNIQKLIDTLHVTSDELLARKGNASHGFVPVPLLGRIAAGDPIPMDEVDDVREAPARFVADDPDAFLLKVDGESVNRVIPDGSFALVSPRHREPNEHDLFAVCVNGHDATIKHVKRLANGFMLVPDSHDPTFRPTVFDYNDEGTETVTIIGKVVWWCAAY